MNKLKPVWVGLLQALGLAIYILIFVAIIQSTQGFKPTNMFLSMASVLMTFVISALICSSLILLYPGVLFFGGEKKKALHILLWSAGWLIVFLAAFLGILVL